MGARHDIRLRKTGWNPVLKEPQSPRKTRQDFTKSELANSKGFQKRYNSTEEHSLLRKSRLRSHSEARF